MVTDDLERVLVGDVRAVEESLHSLVRGLDPNCVVAQDAPGLWAAFDAVERLAGSAKTLLARRVEDARTWQRGGYRSAAEQLASLSGTTITSARSALETSKQVEAFPATAHALREGKLSGAQAELIASAVVIAPDAEEALLSTAARVSLPELRNECMRARVAVDRDGAHERIHRDRKLREYSDVEGAWNITGRGTPEAGAVVRSAINPIIERMFNDNRDEDRRESREAYAFDALVEVCRRALEGEVAEPPATGRKKTAPGYLGLIRADLEALTRGRVEGEEVCEIAGLGPIPVDVARNLLGDSVLKLVITKGVDVVNVTHLGRSATVAQQAALWWRSPECTREGCTRTQRLENDHRDDWANVHETRLDNLDPLCGHDHDLKTLYGWALVAGEGRRPMVPPDDPRHPRNRPPPDP